MRADPLDSSYNQNATELPSGIRKEESTDSTIHATRVSHRMSRLSVVARVDIV